MPSFVTWQSLAPATAPAGTTPEVLKDAGGNVYPLGAVCFNGPAASSSSSSSGPAADNPTVVDATHGLPVQQQAGATWSFAVTQWGTTAVVTGGVAGSVGVGGLAAAGTPVLGQPVLAGLQDNQGNAQFLGGDSNGNQFVCGNKGSGITDTGNPVKIGGQANSAPPTAVTAGQRVNALYNLRGAQALCSSKTNGGSGGDGQSMCFIASLDDTSTLLGVASSLYNAGSGSYDRQRTPTIFKTAQATASGNTALWTPAGGKKFRLMRFKVQVTDNSATSGGAVISIGLQDSTTDLALTHDVWLPSAGLTGAINGWDSGWIDLGNGKLSAAANNVLNINLSAALSAGNVRVTCCGTEE